MPADSTPQKPERPNLFKEGVQRLRALFLPAEGLHIGENRLVAKKDAGDNQDPYWQRQDGTETNLADPVLVRKTANETLTSDTTLQNDNHLLFAIGASETWFFEAFISCEGSVDGDINIAFTVPSGATLRWAGHGLGTGASTSTGDLKANIITASEGGSAFGLGGTGAQAVGIFIWGTVVNSTTAGNLQLQWAQRVSNGTATTVHANSWLKGHQA